MTSWITVCRGGECPEGEVREFVVEGRIVAIINRDGQYFALDGICPHQGGPLGKGSLRDGVLTCPWHGWQFQVETGKCLLSAHIVQPTISIRYSNGEVQIAFDVENPDPADVS